MDKREKRVMDEIQKLGQKYEEEVKEAAGNIVKNIFENKAEIQDAFAIPKGKMEGIYAQAYQLYNAGNYNKAFKTFELLAMLNGKDPRFMFGMAACMQNLKEYKAAIYMFLQSACLDPETPVPYYHAADCCLELGDKISAVVMLHLVIELSKDRQEYSYIKDRSAVLKESLSNEINEEGKKLIKNK